MTEREKGAGGDQVKVGGAGRPKRFVQKSPCLSFEFRAPRWRPWAQRDEVLKAAPARYMKCCRAEEIRSQNQPRNPGCSWRHEKKP